MGLSKIQFYLVVIAFINFVTTRIFGDGRIPVNERRNSDIREPRFYRSIRSFYITFYIARVTVAVRNQKKMFGRDKKCIVTYTTFFLLDQKKEIQVLKCQISVILSSHWKPGGQKQERGYF